MKREVSNTYSDVDGMAIQQCRVYDPNNPKHTDRELARYVNAAERDFQNCLHVSMGGPDATKVGADFGVACAAFLNPQTRNVSVCLPPASNFTFQYFQPLSRIASAHKHIRPKPHATLYPISLLPSLPLT